ncbi:hypothetical protein [Agreia sp. Leaf210]|uniref:hypothetical protein n=1 Tax=Agreia sp. Leaf210 TaxID=1735682 RepID=UPI000B287E76|nr:hypothetical protein [Agreia sp. Leaf210]
MSKDVGTFVATAVQDRRAADFAHYASLAIAAVLLFRLGLTQSFFFDDWAILAPSLDANINLPHVGHWSLTPALVFQAIRDLWGLDSYTPFFLCVLIVHLALAHLIWRIMKRASVAPWLASAFVVPVLFMGSGSENILWAFQFGFIGAVVLALVVVLVVTGRTITWPLGLLAGAAALWAVTFSGTALPLLFAAGLASLYRQRFMRTALVFGPAVVVYGAWFLLEGTRFKTSIPSAFIDGAGQGVVAVSRFASTMVLSALDGLLPLTGAGVVLAVALLIYVVGRRREDLELILPALVLAAAALIFALLTAFSRAGLGLGTASSGRYLYLVTALLIPLLACAGSAVAKLRTAGVFILCVVVAGAGVFGYATLSIDAEKQASAEETSQGRLHAAIALARDVPDTDSRRLAERPVKQWAPDLSVQDLKVIDAKGWVSPEEYSVQDRLDVAPYFWLDLRTGDEPLICSSMTVDATRMVQVPPGTAISFQTLSPGSIGIEYAEGEAVGSERTLTVKPSVWSLKNSGETLAVVDLGGTDAGTYCMSDPG